MCTDEGELLARARPRGTNPPFEAEGNATVLTLSASDRENNLVNHKTFFLSAAK